MDGKVDILVVRLEVRGMPGCLVHRLCKRGHGRTVFKEMDHLDSSGHRHKEKQSKENRIIQGHLDGHGHFRYIRHKQTDAFQTFIF